MQTDRFTEVTSTSFGKRIGDSIKGVVLGVVLFAASIALLFWNEGRSVTTHLSLEESRGAVLPVTADQVNPYNEGKLIHLSGQATSEAQVRDSYFQISAPALRLRRIVEMYQWKEKSHEETRTKLGGGEETVTTYDYNMVWSEDRINSSAFRMPGHDNPQSWPCQSDEWQAAPVTLGSFQLSAALVKKIDNFMPLTMNGAEAGRMINGFRIGNEELYKGLDPTSPRIGDVRVRFKVVYPAEVSVMARQTGNSFAPYLARAGGSVELLQIGLRSPKEMIESAQRQNLAVTWLVRGGGFFIMFMGLALLLKPLSVVAGVVPLLGDLAGIFLGLGAFALAAALSLVTIGTAWLVYRPVLGLALLALAAITLIFARVRAARRAQPAPAPVFTGATTAK